MSECLVILQCVFYSLGIINGLIILRNNCIGENKVK